MADLPSEAKPRAAHVVVAARAVKGWPVVADGIVLHVGVCGCWGRCGCLSEGVGVASAVGGGR